MSHIKTFILPVHTLRSLPTFVHLQNAFSQSGRLYNTHIIKINEDISVLYEDLLYHQKSGESIRSLVLYILPSHLFLWGWTIPWICVVLIVLCSLFNKSTTMDNGTVRQWDSGTVHQCDSTTVWYSLLDHCAAVLPWPFT